MLKQTLQDKVVQEPLITTGPYVDLGSFHDILRGGRDAREQTLSVDVGISPWALREGLGTHSVPSSDIRSFLGTDLSVTFAFDARLNKVRLSSARFTREGKITLDVRRAGTGWSLHGAPKVLREFVKPDFFHFLPTLDIVDRPARRKVTDEVFDQYIRAVRQVGAWSQIFENVNHIAPLRTPVPRYSVLGRMPTSDIGAGGENLLRTLGSEEQVRNSKTLTDLVDSWVSDRFGMLRKLRIEDVDPAGTVRALLGDEQTGFDSINVANMGEGISQLLPIVASTLTTSDYECLLIEQPEIHLHPAAQSDLGDLFIENIGERKRRQFIIETHSEHLLLRIRRRVAEGMISPNDVAILYVERGDEQSSIRQLVLDEKGHFTEWPEGFFEEGYNEALLLAQAAARQEAAG